MATKWNYSLAIISGSLMWLCIAVKGGPRELQVGELHLCMGQDHGRDPPGSSVKSHEGQGSNPGQPAWLHQSGGLL